jgi:signal transduction histidine kinase
MLLVRALPTGPLWARTDRDALEQVLLNLVDNAIKYASEGKELDVRLAQAAAVVTIEVMDRGPGVPGSERERVFAKFHRLDTSLTTRRPGCGLGLTIARRRRRARGGAGVGRERPGGGALFVVLFPALTAVAAPAGEHYSGDPEPQSQTPPPRTDSRQSAGRQTP